MAVLWLDEISAGDLEKVGGKGASLGELTGAGLPVPPGFVVTAGTYRSFIEEAEIDEELFEVVDVDVDDSSALATAADRAQELILETPFPEDLREEILDSYHQVGNGEAFVAVRSSATAEDLPDASFAGQQETFLNVTEEALLDRVRECWASLFTQRAIYYRQEQGFDHSAVNIAVVVQQMVDAEKSGVMFTSHPSTGDPTMIIEAAWGLGEAVVSGAVSPDNYVVPREEDDIDVTVAEKKVMHEKDEETGETVEREVPEDRRNARVLSDDEIGKLVELGERVEDHYDTPQDVEWAIVGDDVYMLQSRPITTIDEGGSGGEAPDASGAVDAAKGVTDGSGSVQAASGGDGGSSGGSSGDVIVDGLGSSPGTVSGAAQIVTKLDDLDKVKEGDIIVTEMTMPDMVPAMKRASGIITDEGGMTSHAAIVSRELGVPAIVGTTNATTVLEDGQVVTLDGDKGAVLEGQEVEPDEETEPVEEVRPQSPVKPMTATEVKVNVSIPEAAERAAATGADGVGLLRTEHMILSLNQTPAKFIAENGEDAYIQELVQGIRGVADEFYPRPVRVRTLDAPTDEFRQLEGGEDEPKEHNPMLGYRGIRRSLDRPGVFAHELEAFRRLYEMGYDNVEIMFPLVNDAEDIYQAKRLMEEAGIDPEKRKWGAMIETPASALSVEGMAEAGIDFASFGTNDLTQYTLAVDRNNEHVADRFDELHPSILKLIGNVIETCREHDVDTSICGQAGSKPEMVQFLVDEGVSSISANIDAVRDVQHEVKRTEQKLLLDSVR
ncbi:phosphoenolpyruvate synthase [Natronorubrum sp. FCH18a]|uniref:phosphoenolpyruvate synthase n=1 Tax=Natronorubrum sp. FCH18a TaxID=3447018 RepID=UPI003F50F3BA